ncbi:MULTISPECIES: hypothetical protein [unclassified Pseudarthrobacter]|uniref:hypothetical protein n=1 Tax=unclassified Pseudarthrobacter TaxID=2647000 RepID=UPI0030784D15
MFKVQSFELNMPKVWAILKVVNYESELETMNRYSVAMKSEDASPTLRKLTEGVAAHGRRFGYPPQERFYEDFALLAYAVTGGWAIGLRIDFTPDSWSIAEVVASPAGEVRTLPDVNSAEVRSYVEAAVGRARGRLRAEDEQLAKLATNSAFIQERFETWRDKTARRTNVEYAALAAKYAEQIRLGNSRATATLAGLVDMSPSVMAQRIKEARRRALLTPGEQGRASGALTPLGVLYTDPLFPGISKHRRAGMTQREIADKYGIDERFVWAASQGESFSDDYGPLPAIPFPSGMTDEEKAEDILREFQRRRDDRGR